MLCMSERPAKENKTPKGPTPKNSPGGNFRNKEGSDGIGGGGKDTVLGAPKATGVYSPPPFWAKKPFLMCTVTAATIITLRRSADATGVSSPSARNRPPPVSARPAISAWRRPGRNPIISQN